MIMATTSAAPSFPVSPLPLPSALPLTQTAFFLDFDGTLVELAPTPDSIHVRAGMLALLRELRVATQGAVAIVSGRGIDNLDALLHMQDMPMAGLHGAQRRDASGNVTRTALDDMRLPQMAQTLAALVREHPGLLLENKGASLALHYRNAPECAALVRQATQELVAACADAYELQPGKMVCEIRPLGVDKGSALRAFLEEPPFAGRRPVFAGDDLTDEKGFAVVNVCGGLSVKVGEGETMAHVRVASVDALLAWLKSLVIANHH
jgi:trehalose 6-phosphate phosphatase